MYEHTPTPPPKRRDGVILALVIAAVAVLLGVAALLFVRATTTIEGQAIPAADSPAGTTTKPRDPLAPKPTGGPQVPGWQVIELNNGRSFDTDRAYDVPQGWTAVPGAYLSYGDGKDLEVFGPALYKKGYCAANASVYRAMAGVLIEQNKGDIKVGAADAARKVANVVYLYDGVQPKIEMSAPEPVTVFRSVHGVLVTAKVTITNTRPDSCVSSTATVVVAMLDPNKPGEATSVCLTAMSDQNIPDATPESDLKRIVTSLHLVA